MNVVSLSTTLLKFSSKLFAHQPKSLLHELHLSFCEAGAAEFGHKDQVGLEGEDDPPSTVVVKILLHRPIIRCRILSMQTKTLQLRIKDKHCAVLRAWAVEVNSVWNFCNEVSHKAATPYTGKAKWLTGFDLQILTSGYVKCDGTAIGSTTVQQTCEEYATRRKQFKRSKLNWRVSNRKSSKRSLGWVPFKSRALKYKSGQIKFNGKFFSLWDSYDLSKYELRSGSFSEDSRGRWYLNVCVQVPEQKSSGTAALGVDLGCKTAVTTSDGTTLEGRWLRKLEPQIKVAQSRGQKRRVRSLQAKVKNQRKDALHKLSTSMAKQYGAIFVGNVSSAKLVKTRMAKSTLDAGWASFKTMLEYKCNSAGVVFREVNEAYTTQTCSCCGVKPASAPKGLAGLNKRVWTCSNCGTTHDRDVNAACNIREAGLGLLAEGIPSL